MVAVRDLFCFHLESSGQQIHLYCSALHLLLSPERNCAWTALFATLGRKQYQSYYGKGSSRELMALLMGAPLCSLLFPAFIDSWLYLLKTHQAMAVFRTWLVNGSDKEVDSCLQKNLQNLDSQE